MWAMYSIRIMFLVISLTKRKNDLILIHNSTIIEEILFDSIGQLFADRKQIYGSHFPQQCVPRSLHSPKWPFEKFDCDLFIQQLNESHWIISRAFRNYKRYLLWFFPEKRLLLRRDGTEIHPESSTILRNCPLWETQSRCKYRCCQWIKRQIGMKWNMNTRRVLLSALLWMTLSN